MRQKVGREQVISSIYFHFIYNIRVKCISHHYQHPAGSKAEHKKIVKKLSPQKQKSKI